MEQDFEKAVRTLVTELNHEASGLISRKALIAMDRVQQLLEAETVLRATVAQMKPVADKHERIA